MYMEILMVSVIVSLITIVIKLYKLLNNKIKENHLALEEEIFELKIKYNQIKNKLEDTIEKINAKPKVRK